MKKIKIDAKPEVDPTFSAEPDLWQVFPEELLRNQNCDHVLITGVQYILNNHIHIVLNISL